MLARDVAQRPGPSQTAAASYCSLPSRGHMGADPPNDGLIWGLYYHQFLIMINLI